MGVGLAVALSVIDLFARLMRPNDAVMGNVPNLAVSVRVGGNGKTPSKHAAKVHPAHSWIRRNHGSCKRQ
jgi:hypothetical protein